MSQPQSGGTGARWASTWDRTTGRTAGTSYIAGGIGWLVFALLLLQGAIDGPEIPVPRPDREFLPMAVAATQGAGPYEAETRWVHLRSGSFIPAGALEANWRRLRDDRIERPTVRVLASFEFPPSSDEFKALERAGVRIGRALSGGVRLALLEAGLDGDSLRELGIRWVGGFYPEDKLPQRVLRSGFGSWAKHEDGTVVLRLRYFPDVSAVALREQLESAGAIVEWVRPALEAASIRLAPEQLQALLALDAVRWVEEAPPDPVEFNDSSRARVGAEVLQEPPYSLTGDGVMVGVCDSGQVDALHQDFLGRIELLKPGVVTEHATHVAGTLGGSGAASEQQGGTHRQWRGVAPGVRMGSFDFHDPIPTHQTLVDRGGIISQNSWGLGININTCNLYGTYGSLAPDFDRLVTGLYGRPLSVVFAVGNLRTGDAPNSCGVGPYGTVGPPGTAKNALSVGAVDSVTDAMTLFSGWGPLMDGRLKPEVVAPGAQMSDDSGVTSTLLGNRYGVKSGTSMAAPVVSGGMALLAEKYRALFAGRDPVPSALRALLIHTCEDLDDATSHYNPGPDYASGYGRVRLPEAVEQLASGGFLVGQVGHRGTNEYWVEVSEGTSEVRFTLVWDDPPGLENAALALVNDLDLVVWNPLGERHYPWTLDPLNPSVPAVRTAADRRNVIEQVWVGDNPVPGSWLVQVVGTAVVEGDEQTFSLALTPPLPAMPPVLTLEEVRIVEDPNGGSNQNGFFDPGEELLLEAVLRNRYVPSVESLSARLEAGSPGVTVLDGEVGFPPLLAGRSVTNSNPFRIRLSRDLSCGTVVSLTQIAEADGFVFESPIELVVGAYVVTNSGTNVFLSSDVAVAIPDGGRHSNPAESTLTLEDSGEVGNLAVWVRIDHPWTGDLGAELEHPDGTRVPLWLVTGNGGKDYGIGECGGEVGWTILRDGASEYLTNATAPFLGSYRPAKPLAALAEKPIAGTWTLRLVDWWPGDQGTLLCWGLDLGFEESGFICEPFNRSPAALAQVVEVVYGQATAIQLAALDPDDDPLTFALNAAPEHGTVMDFDPLTGSLVYVPDAGYVGADALSFTVHDGLEQSLPAVVTLTLMEAAADVGLEWIPSSVVVGVDRGAAAQLILTNRGPNTVHGLVVELELPAAAIVERAAPQAGTVSATNRLLRWEIGTLPAMETTVLHLEVRASAPGVHPLPALATFDEIELVPDDNVAVWGIDARPLADLAIGFLSSAEPLLLEGLGWAEVTVTNFGPEVAHGVVVEVDLPDGLEWVAAEIDRGEWTHEGGFARWNVSELEVDEVLVWRWTFAGRAVGDWSTTVTVAAWEVDELQENNALSAVLSVTPASDLALRVSGPAVSLLGQTELLEISVTNAGPSPAPSVVVRGDLDPALTGWSGSVEQGEWWLEAERWEWAVGTLAPGEERALQLETTSVAPGFPTHRIGLSAAVADPNPGNNHAEFVIEIKPAADLQVTVAPLTLLAVNGEGPVAFLVANAGPSDASGVVLEVELQPGLEAEPGDLESGEWTQVTRPTNIVWIWQVGDLPSGELRTGSLTFLGLALGSWTNSALAQAIEPDPIPDNASATFRVEVRSDADLQLTGLLGQESMLQGQWTTQRVDLVNAGPNLAKSIEVHTMLSPGWGLISAEVSKGLMKAAAVGLTWEIATLESGADAWMLLVLEALEAGSLTNRLGATAAEVDLDLSNNQLELVVEVRPAADLRLAVVHPAKVLLGESHFQDWILVNAGPSSATQVAVSTQLPEGLAWVGAEPELGTVTSAGGAVIWSAESLVSGAEVRLRLELLAESLGDWTNEVTASALEADPSPEDNRLEVVTGVRLDADLALNKAVTASPVPIGQSLEYILVLKNLGPNPAHDVVVEDAMPEGLVFVDASVGAGSWEAENGVVRWTLETLPQGEQVVLSLAATAVATGSWTNLARVDAHEFDPQLANNTAAVAAVVIPAADLAVELQADPSWSLGWPGEWYVTIVNLGPSEAEWVVVNGVVDALLEFGEVQVSAGDWTQLEAGQWVWNLDSLAPGTDAVLRLELTGWATGLATNRVEVASAVLDREPANNRGEVIVEVVPAANLQLAVQGDARIRFGVENTTQSWTVTNAGPSEATAVLVSGQLESGLVITQHEVSSGSWTLAGEQWTWELGVLAMGEGAVLTLQLDGVALGAVSHTVLASADQADPAPEDNLVTWVTGVRLDTDLGVTKVALTPTVLLGATCVFEIGLGNAGPHSAGGIRVSDALPQGLSFVGATASLGEVTYAAGRVEWAVPTLDVGAQAVLWLTNQANALGWLTNQVRVVADEFDPVPDNDLAEANIEVLPAADLILEADSTGLLVQGSVFAAGVWLTNAGPNSATGVQVAGSSAEGAAVIGGNPGTGHWLGEENGDWLWLVGDLAAGEGAALELLVLGLADGIWTNRLAAMAHQGDPQPGNNEVEMVVRVRSDADLSVTAATNFWQVLRGELFTPEIRVHNAGPNEASEVVVVQPWTDDLVLPEPVVSTGEWRLDATGLVWSIARLPAGGEAWMRLPTAAQTEGVLTRSVAVEAAQTDLEPGNNLFEWSVEALPAADLAVGFAGVAVHLPGDPQTLQIVLDNVGPSDASQIVVLGLAADDWSGAAAEPQVGNWKLPAEGGWSWELDELLPGDSAVLTLTLPGRELGDRLYRVSVSGAEADPVSENNQAAWFARVRLEADLGIAASAAPSSVLQGAEFQLSLTVTNLGPNLTHSVLVHGDLPAGAEVIDVTGDGGTWTEIAGGFFWELEELEPEFAARLAVTLLATAPGLSTNRVTVIAEEVDFDQANNTALWGLTVEPVAELALTLPEPGSRLLGQEWTEVLWVTNAGPAMATQLLVHGQVPEGLALLALATDYGTAAQDEGAWTWEPGELPSEQAVAIELLFGSAAPGLWTNRVELAAAESGLVPTDRVGEWTVEVLPAADLAIFGGYEGVLALRHELTQAIVVTNRGPSDATGVVVQGVMGGGLRILGWDSTAGQWLGGNGDWTWEVGDLPVGSQVSLWLETEAAVLGDWTNRVEVAAHQSDPELSDNSALWVNRVWPLSDLAVSASVAMELVVVGRPVTLDLALTNFGPDAARKVRVTHEFPGGVLTDVVEASSGLITHGAGQVIWHLEELAANTKAHVMITLMPTFAAGLTNRIEVTGDVVDPVPANNQIIFTLDAQPQADLQLTQTTSTQRVLAGDAFAYRLEVSNFAPYAVPSVTVSNSLPDGVELVSAVSSLGTVTATGQLVTAELGVMPVGGVATLDLAVRAYQLGVITNVARVSSWAADPDNPALCAVTTVVVVRDPPLEAWLDDERLELTWSAISGDYELHYTDSLSEPVVWRRHPNRPSVAGGRLTVTIKTVSQGRFYRLVKP